MNVKRIVFIVLLLAGLVAAAGATADAADTDGLAALTARAVERAASQLGPLDDPAAVACLTNAGYASWRGQSTSPVLDELPRLTAVSVGRGNLLVRPDRHGAPLYFMFIKKAGPKKLLMSHGVVESGDPLMSAAHDIHVEPGVSFAPFSQWLGDNAFNLVSLANGWAMGLPGDMMRAALIHGHLCCGVFSGYFTARFIEKHCPLRSGEHYVYVGAPSWCQDDYICDYLRLTPGTHGYVTMIHPWAKAWSTAGKTYDNLGGVVVCYDPKRQRGRAYVLRFDWRQDEFRRFAGLPQGQELDFRGQPWLHKAYDRFFLSRRDQPEFFVSIWQERALDGQADYDAVLGLGANPLAFLLGPPDKAPTAR